MRMPNTPSLSAHAFLISYSTHLCSVSAHEHDKAGLALHLFGDPSLDGGVAALLHLFPLLTAQQGLPFHSTHIDDLLNA
jgi:hypothetical protein